MTPTPPSATGGLAKSIAEVERVAALVEVTQPVWSGHLKAVCAALQSQGWVSVKERLPAESGRVWAYFDSGEQENVLFDGKQWIYGDGSPMPQDEFHDCVTHWRELPSPPATTKD